ncbi:hypothetical protein [Frondihabitans cladoniiphilus]|uniref:Asp23/Gls24 family envelope stress response protein n=1 Tax=Frondihabitans cladoniiphilus TaxID=715785 RepID=A0ABP8W184_9MICO
MTDPQTAVPGDDATGAALRGWSPDPDSPAATLPLARGPIIPGHISIAPRALTKVGSAVVAEALDVNPHAVRVGARDDDGNLALQVETTMRIPPLSADVEIEGGGVLATVRNLQRTVTTRVHDITGRAVSRVDVTVTGSELDRTERVR